MSAQVLKPLIGPGIARRGPGSPNETAVINVTPSRSASTELFGQFHIGVECDQFGKTAGVAIVGLGQKLDLGRIFGANPDIREAYFRTESDAIYHLTSAKEPGGRDSAILSDSVSGKRVLLNPAELAASQLRNGQCFHYQNASCACSTSPIVEIVCIYREKPPSFAPETSAETAERQGEQAVRAWRSREPALANMRFTFLYDMADKAKPECVSSRTDTIAVVAGRRHGGYLLSGDSACDLSELYQSSLEKRPSTIERILFRTASGQVCTLSPSPGQEGITLDKRDWHNQGREPLLITAGQFADPKLRPDGALIIGQPFRLGETELTSPVAEILVLEKAELSAAEARKRRKAGCVSTMLDEFESKPDAGSRRQPPVAQIWSKIRLSVEFLKSAWKHGTT